MHTGSGTEDNLGQTGAGCGGQADPERGLETHRELKESCETQAFQTDTSGICALPKKITCKEQNGKMTRTFRYALTAVLSAVVVMPAFAQDNFPDVPDNHWAYEALARMKREGLLVGYPDGLFRGGRPATRYELAVAVHATYTHLKNITDGLQTQIDALNAAIKGGFASKEDLDNLRAALTALQNDLNALKAGDIADLKRMAATFEKELASLGVDVAQMKKDLGDLSDRVTNLENRLPVDISGDINFLLFSGYGNDDDGLFGVTVDGRPTGVSPDDGELVGGDRDLHIWHEAALTLTSAMKSGPKFKGTFVWSNMIEDDSDSSGGFNQGTILPESSFEESQGEVYVQNLSVTFDTSVAGLGFSAEAGRVMYKVSPYIYMRQDTTPYFSNDRWDNHMWTFDGAVLGFNFGTAKLNVWGGKGMGSDGEDTATDEQFQIGTSDQVLGTHLMLPLGDTGAINLAYLWLNNNDDSSGVDRVDVFGGDIKFNFGNFMVNAGYSQSDTKLGSETVNDEDNTAWFARVGLESGKWGASVGYREIEPLFMAPGDWGRIGTIWNPTDIEGFMAKAHFDLSRDLRLTAMGEWYNGVDDTTLASTFSEDDDIRRYVIGLEYKLASDYELALGIEDVEFDYADTVGFDNIVNQRWWNIGFGWSLSDNAKLKFMWQVSDVDGDNVGIFVPFSEARGGLITTQLSVKF